MADMNELLRQAQEMQERLMAAQAESAETVVEGQAGGGLVKVTTTGGLDFRSVTIATEAVARIDQLFAIERLINGHGAEARLATRAASSAPILAELEPWLRVSRKSEIGKAIDYTLKRWPALTRFMTDGRICLSNNAAERALRGIAVGRHNWTFAGSDRGGERAAGGGGRRADRAAAPGGGGSPRREGAARAPAPPCVRDSGGLERRVHPSLHVPQEPEHRLVGERQDLRHDRPGDLLGRVDPVVGVEDPGPAQAAGAAPVRSGLGVDVEGQAPVVHHPREEVGVV